VLISASSYLQLSNVPMSTAPRGWVFATPELDRVHHSNREGELNASYGHSLIVWDTLFGGRLEPDPDRPLHASIGLPGIEVEQTDWPHRRLPFVWERLHGQPAPGAGAGHVTQAGPIVGASGERRARSG
jgi:sterol desaturase/sphingolipid hydroxylase (fatty acid hydroxylase superfamily)